MVGGGVESDYSVCPRPFLQFCQFKLVRLHQVTLGYIILRQFTLEGRDVELDNIVKIQKGSEVAKDLIRHL